MSMTPAKIAVALGQAAPEPDSVTSQQWVMWIGDAVMLIADRQATLAVEGTIDEAKLDYVVREAVIAHIKKPDDATQVAVSVDDASTTRVYRSGKGRVTILDEWWSLLGLNGVSGAFTVDSVGFGTVHLPWCALNFGATYCSCGVDIAGVPIFEGANE